MGLSWGTSSGQALPSILFLASAYSASRWARDLTCGVGLFWFKGDPNDPLLAGRFKMRIWGGGAAGRESSCITIVVFNGDRGELLLDSLRADQQETIHKELVIWQTVREALGWGGWANNGSNVEVTLKIYERINLHFLLEISYKMLLDSIYTEHFPLQITGKMNSWYT